VSPGADRLGQTLEWMDRGTTFFVGQLGMLSDRQLADSSRLPDWTRLHIVSHMARNARALMNLLRWAETGVESPMYSSPEHRRADIEAGASLPAAEVRADALAEAGRLRSAIDGLPDDAWASEVRTALGYPVPASEVPWMRVREVWVHAVDLGAGADFSDIDEQVAGVLFEEAAERFAGRDDCPPTVLVTDDGGRRFEIGPASASPARVTGSTHALAGWLLGRTGGSGLEAAGPLPELPTWM